MNWRSVAVVGFCVAGAAGCAWIPEMQPVLDDPEVQKAATGVVTSAIRGDWIGAAARFGELVFAAAGAYKAAMIRRDGLRTKRGEPTGKPVAATVAGG